MGISPTCSCLIDPEKRLCSIFTSMPIVLQVNGFRLYFYSDEGEEPYHIRVERGGAILNNG